MYRAFEQLRNDPIVNQAVSSESARVRMDEFIREAAKATESQANSEFIKDLEVGGLFTSTLAALFGIGFLGDKYIKHGKTSEKEKQAAAKKNEAKTAADTKKEESANKQIASVEKTSKNETKQNETVVLPTNFLAAEQIKAMRERLAASAKKLQELREKQKTKVKTVKKEPLKTKVTKKTTTHKRTEEIIQNNPKVPEKNQKEK